MLKLDWLDWLGDWNPQLLREIKGRVKSRNLVIAGAISLVGQFILFLAFQTQLPIPTAKGLTISSKYCTGTMPEYGYQRECLADGFGGYQINWQLWWLELFVMLSLIGIFALLVAGTYLLIADLTHEERRDTLNFIRLSPRSPQNLLIGKLLGVPILLYFIAVLAIPLHIAAGLSAGVPLTLILTFYGVLATSCWFFYSAAQLFSLVSSWLGGFQAWLGSGTVLTFLWMATLKPITDSPLDWLSLFSPSIILPYLVATTGIQHSDFSFSYLEMTKLQWFGLPLGASIWGVVALTILNYTVWTYWGWQALQRRFPNPSKTIFSKGQSYLFVACFTVITLGFAMVSPKLGYADISSNLILLQVYNFAIFFGLILALTPSRQAVQDWARYQKQQGMSQAKVWWKRSLVQDLMWGEKSPALVAIAVNLLISATILMPWIILRLEQKHKLVGLLSLVISLNLILIYAAIAQLVIFMRTQKQALWIIGTLSAVIILPPIILAMLKMEPVHHAGWWLFTSFAWVSIKDASNTTILLSILGQWTILTLGVLQITRQVRQIGASSTKALFAASKQRV